MRPLPKPFDRIAAGLEAPIDIAGSELLTRRLLTKDLAFPPEERDAFGLRGLLPDRVLSIEEQVELEVEHLRRKDDDLERYIGLAALQDRNATLFYRVLAEHVEEFLPVVYTPTVGRACQEYSHILRRTRGVWITPEDVHRVPQVLSHAPYEDVRLIVVTDNERILGLGDQGAGGMAIPIGKLALYTAACGIHPALTLPVSLDVGTDNQELLSDPLYIGHRAPRLRGAAYNELIEAFVEGVQQVWPGCLIQWEDFKGTNALQILERYRYRVPSFNDDIQGTAAVVVAGVIAGAKALEMPLAEIRVVLAGAGAAGIGIARLLGQALAAEGLAEVAVRRAIVLVDSRGLVHAGRDDIDDHKRALAASLEACADLGLPTDEPPGLEAVVRAVRPTALVGTTGIAGAFSEPVIRAAADGTPRPIILPLSNPTVLSEAAPDDVLRWTHGRAIVATGSPFPSAVIDDVAREIAQANNVFIFPGLGLGTIVAGARAVTDSMVLAAARALAASVSEERLAAGVLYPAIRELRAVSASIALAVAREAVAAGVADVAGGGSATDASDAELQADLRSAAWWPAYVRYVPAGNATRAGGGNEEAVAELPASELGIREPATSI
jgi:malate dehydrogenase (oxaloacetate-decarboxylating)